MNKRIMKKKFNKWETARVYNITVSFEDVPFVWDAFCAQDKPNWEEFAVSRNAMRAVKSYCKKNVWHTGACDNVKDMYRCMCEEIHKEREYQKHIEEQKRMQRKYDDSTYVAPVTDERIQSMMTQGNWRGDLEHPTTRSDMIQSCR